MAQSSTVDPAAPFLRPALAGAAATLSGIGLARFAYVPLFPAMVAAGWTSGPEAGLLGALNFAGYLFGVLGGRTAAHRLGTARALDLGMALAATAFAACSWNLGLSWLAFWRGLAGFAGGVLMALAGPAVQGAVRPSARGSAGGVVIGGVGIGVIIGSLAVPVLLRSGVSATWLGLAAFVLVLWGLARPHWPDTPIHQPDPAASPVQANGLYLLYALSAAGMVPHMVYFVDFAVRGRGFDPATGALIFVLFGAGGILGTLGGGRAADGWGGVRGLQVWFTVQLIAVGLALAPGRALLLPSAFLGGFGGIGITAVALARARELAGPAAGLIWVRGTALYALSQAVTGFALTGLFARTGSHEALFAAGAVLSVAGLIVTLRER